MTRAIVWLLELALQFRALTAMYRKDNLYEFGGGLVWEFVKSWSLRPEILYTRDQSNTAGFNYASTEVWMNVRKAFEPHAVTPGSPRAITRGPAP